MFQRAYKTPIWLKGVESTSTSFNYMKTPLPPCLIINRTLSLSLLLAILTLTTMVGLLRLKKSSSNLVLNNRNVNTPTTPPVPVPAAGLGSMGVPAATLHKGDRWSGEDLVPSDGYSGLVRLPIYPVIPGD
jgi:hypothetical protein